MSTIAISLAIGAAVAGLTALTAGLCRTARHADDLAADMTYQARRALDTGEEALS